jgi:hypothetical protein
MPLLRYTAPRGSSAASSSITSEFACFPPPQAEDLLELVKRRYERASTLCTSNRPVEDWGKLLGDNAAVAAMLNCLLHHAQVIQFWPQKLATKTADLKRSQLTA